MTDLNNYSRAELTDTYNEMTGKDIKPTSYTKAKLLEMITDLLEQDTPLTPTPQGEEVETPADEPTQETGSTLTCPLCETKAPEDQFEQVGEEGTFLGACLRCPSCDKVYSGLTLEEVPAPKTKGKRKILNPQPTINRKTEWLREKASATLEYDREERLWFVYPEDEENLDPIGLTSRQLSEKSKEELVSMVKAAEDELKARRGK